MIPTETKQLSLDILDEFKASQISCLDVQGVTDLTDYMIICSATSSRHSKTLADQLRRAFKPKMDHTPYVEEDDTGEWIIIDLYDVIIHIMLPKAREYYHLESLWQNAIDKQSLAEEPVDETST